MASWESVPLIIMHGLWALVITMSYNSQAWWTSHIKTPRNFQAQLFYITVISHEHQVISNHPTVCSTDSWGWQQRKQHSCTLLILFRENPLITGKFPSQRVVPLKNVSITCGHHVLSLNPLSQLFYSFVGICPTGNKWWVVGTGHNNELQQLSLMIQLDWVTIKHSRN